MPNITNAANARGASLLWNRSHRIKLVLALTLCLAGISSSVRAAPSHLDPTFGDLGMVISAPGGSPMFTSSGMALQTDGKIVIGGNRVLNGIYAGMIVARYNADGSLDTTFNNGGWNLVTFEQTSEFAAAVAVQPDGKIVIGGSLRILVNNFPRYSWGIARFNSDGSVDTTFDTDGKAIINFDDFIGGVYSEYFAELKVGSDGKIVAAGYGLNAAVDDRFLLAKLNADGSPDTAFGTNGKVADIPRGSNHDRLGDMVMLPDNSIVIVGFHWGFGGSRRIAGKFSSTGAKLWEYNEGVFGHPVPQTEILNGVAALPDGKLIVVGYSGGKIAAFRINSNGTPDNTFINPAGQPGGQLMSVAVHADGKVVATIENGLFSLVRYNANGSLDSSFGIGGFANTDISSGGDYSAEVLIQPDGKILVGGTSQFGDPIGYYISMVRYLGASAVPHNTLFDYDGDGRADVSVFRPSQNKWYILRSTDQGVTQQIFALAGDVPVPSDFDGDSRTDMAIYRPSSADWWSLSTINGAQVAAHWGQPGVVPLPSDFDGDGKSDYIFYLPANSTWYRWGSTVGASYVTFGLSGDKPLTGDFDGDGKSDPAIYRPSTGHWWYAASSAGGAHRAGHWGISTDVPAPADYDGDGSTDLAVYRPAEGVWYIFNSASGSPTIINFGLAEDKPVPADYDGDGKADIAVFRPSTGIWYLLRSTSGFTALQFGIATDIPTPNAFVP